MSYTMLLATFAFAELATLISSVSEKSLGLLERFVVLLYDRTNSCTAVNVARKQLFSRNDRAVDNIPPSRDALLQHVKRACF